MRKGEKMSDEMKQHLSRIKMGTPAWNKGLKNTWSNTDGLKLGHGWNRGKRTPEGSIQKMVETRKAKGNYIAWNKGKQNPSMIGNTHAAGNIPWNKGRVFEAVLGEKNVNWKGGVTGENRRIKLSVLYRNWRKQVFKRDDYRCQACGAKGKKLHADHVMPFAFYPDLRLEVLNGRTLCRECHWKTETWGSKTDIFGNPATSPTKISCTINDTI